MSYLAGAGAVIGAGAQVASLFGPGESGPSFGPGEAYSQLSATNPAFRELGFIFGKGKQRKGSPFGTSLQDLVRNYSNDPTTYLPGTNTPLWSSIFGSGDQFAQTMAGLRSSVDNLGGAFQPAIDTASLYNATGNPTDGSAYFNEAIRRLRTEAIPNAAEVAGLGVQSSGFANAAGQASEDLLGQASLANIDLAEAAANRRLQASPLLASLLTSQVSAPLNAQTQLAGFGTNLSNIFNQERMGPLNLFQNLYQMGSNPGQFVQPSYNPTDPSAGYLAAANGISGILDSLSQFKLGASTSDNNTTNNYSSPTWDASINSVLGY